MKKLLFTMLAAAGVISAAAVDIYMAGDSTMADYSRKHAPQTGWGQALRRYARPGVKVHNLARPGKSTRSFLAEGHWTALLNQVSPGDYVFIQFGHNDANPKNPVAADAEYRENMRRLVRDVKEKQAVPVICTSIVFMSFRDGKISQSEYFGNYSKVAREVAAEEKADLIDLNEWSKSELSKLGMEKAATYYMFVDPGQYPAFPKGRRDSTHLRESGAHFYARGMLSIAREKKFKVAEFFNDTPSDEAAEEKADAAGGRVDMSENFRKFVTDPGSDAGEEEYPWTLICTNGAKIPLCNGGMLNFDHTVGELRLMSKARIVSGKFKARIRINEAVPPFNAFIGPLSVRPWMKNGAAFHFNNSNLRADMTIDGKHKAAPPLRKGQWHDLEISRTDDTVTYAIDGKELFSGPAQGGEIELGALFVMNCRNGGKINMDVQSVSLEGRPAGGGK